MRKVYIQILIVGSLITLSLVISVSVGLLVAYGKADKDWLTPLIGSMGNIIGGIIGGFVAYFVAAYQITKTDEKDIKLNVIRNENLITVLKEEISHNKVVIKVMERTGKIDKEVLKEQISINTWEMVKIELASVLPNTSFLRISTMYRRLGVLNTCNEDEVQMADVIAIIPELNSAISDLKSLIENGLSK